MRNMYVYIYNIVGCPACLCLCLLRLAFFAYGRKAKENTFYLLNKIGLADEALSRWI